ncbi:MAG: GNAT family N-acetyltransferase, partial [Burkholderiales bacterium]
MNFTITPATRADLPTVVDLIRALAVYEKLEHMMISTVEDFDRELFGAGAKIECVIAREGDLPVGFALFFNNFSTFLGRKGLYLEDLFVDPSA